MIQDTSRDISASRHKDSFGFSAQYLVSGLEIFEISLKPMEQNYWYPGASHKRCCSCCLRMRYYTIIRHCSNKRYARGHFPKQNKSVKLSCFLYRSDSRYNFRTPATRSFILALNVPRNVSRSGKTLTTLDNRSAPAFNRRSSENHSTVSFAQLLRRTFASRHSYCLLRT